MSNTLNCSQREMFNIKSVTASFILLKVISILSCIPIKKALFSLNSVKDKTLLQQKHCQECYAEKRRTNPTQHYRSSTRYCYQQIFKQSLLYPNIAAHSIVWKPKAMLSVLLRWCSEIISIQVSCIFILPAQSGTMLKVQKIHLTWYDFLRQSLIITVPWRHIEKLDFMLCLLGLALVKTVPMIHFCLMLMCLILLHIFFSLHLLKSAL